MSTFQNPYFSNFSNFSLSKEISKDFADLVEFIFAGYTLKMEFLELPENFPSELGNIKTTWTKTEGLLIDHIVNKPNEIFVLDSSRSHTGLQYNIDFNGMLLPVSHVVISILNLERGIIVVTYLSGYHEGAIALKQSRAILSLSNQMSKLISMYQGSKEMGTTKTHIGYQNFELENYLENDDKALWKLGEDNGKLEVNSMFREILGYNITNDLVLDSLTDLLKLIHPDDKVKFKEKLLKLDKKKRNFDFLECRMRHRSGSYIWTFVSCFDFMFNKDDNIKSITGELHDITAQKKAWKQIEHLDPTYSSVVQAGFNWLSVIDKSGDYTYVNASSGFVMGYTPHELVGKNLYNFIHPDDKEKVIIDVSKFINNETFISSPFRYQHKNGTWKWLEIILVNLLNDPMIEGIAINVRDISSRIASRERLITSEKKHRLLFNSSPLPKYIIDLHTYKIIEVNDTMVKHYGYSREELLSMTTMELRPKSEVVKLIKTLKEIQHKDGTNKLGIFTHQKKNGELMQMDLVVHRLQLDGLSCLLVACNDISDREKYLESLTESETRLRQATSIAKLGYWILNLKDYSIEWSEDVYKIWERNKDSFNLNYDNFLDTIHPSDRETFSKKNESNISNLEALDFIHRIITPDGAIKWVHEMVHFITDHNSSINKLHGTVQDITQQKNKEIQLRLVESVVTNTKDAVMITEAEPFDEPGPRIIYVNEAFTQMTGYSAEEVIGKTPRILQGPKSDKNELKKLGESMRRWEPSEITIVNYKKNGDEFWVNFSLNPVADDRGWYTHWISIERDVTEQIIQEHKKALMSAISKCFQEEKMIQICLTNVLGHLLKFGGYILGEIYFPIVEDGLLTITAKYTDKAEGRLFFNQTETLQSVLYGQDMPGIVWEKQVNEVWSASDVRGRHIRTEAARKSGIVEMAGIPITYLQMRLGVLVLGCGKELNYMAKNNEFLSELGNHLSSEIRRKQQELELEEIFNCSPDIVVIANTGGYIKKINPAASHLLGYSEKEMLNRSFLDFVHDYDLKKVLQDIGDIIQEHHAHDPKTIQGDYPIHSSVSRYITKGGDIKWLDWTFTGALQKGSILAVGRDVTEHNKLQSLLKMSNELSRIGTYELDLVNGKIFWSDMTKEIYEVDQNFEPSEKNYMKFYKGDGYFKRNIELIDRAINQAESFDYQMPIVTEKGNERWIRFIGKPEFSSNKCTRIVGSVQDIHKLKIAQLSFKEAFKEKNRILESIGDAFLAVDKAGEITYSNKQAQILFKSGRNSILGKTFKEALGNIETVYKFPQKSDHSLDNILKKTEEIYHPEFNKWLEVITYPAKNGLSIFIKDISERTEAQAAVKESNERFKKATEATKDVIYDRDLNEGLMFVSNGFKTLFGHEFNSNSQKIQFWKNHLHPEDVEPIVESLKKALDNPKIKKWTGEYRFQSIKGQYKFIRDTCIIIRDSEGKALRVIGAMSDISIHKFQEESLKKLNQELSEHSANIEIQNNKLREIAWTQSHIIRAPVARLMSIINLLKGDLLDETEKEEMLDHIFSSAEEIDEVIKDVVKKSESVGIIK